MDIFWEHPNLWVDTSMTFALQIMVSPCPPLWFEVFINILGPFSYKIRLLGTTLTSRCDRSWDWCRSTSWTKPQSVQLMSFLAPNCLVPDAQTWSKTIQNRIFDDYPGSWSMIFNDYQIMMVSNDHFDDYPFSWFWWILSCCPQPTVIPGESTQAGDWHDTYQNTLDSKVDGGWSPRNGFVSKFHWKMPESNSFFLFLNAILTFHTSSGWSLLDLWVSPH